MNFFGSKKDKKFLNNSSKEDIVELLLVLLYGNQEYNMWKYKVIGLTQALISVLDEKRSRKEIVLNLEIIEYYLDLNNLVKLFNDNKELLSVKQDLQKYLSGIPSFDIKSSTFNETSLESHKYIADEIKKILKVVKHIENMYAKL